MDIDEDFAVGSEELLDDELDNESVSTPEERHVDAQGASGAGVQASWTTDTRHPIEYDDASASPVNVTTQRRASDGPWAEKQPLATHGTSPALVDKAQADLLWTSPMTPGPSAPPQSHEQPEAWQGSKSKQGLAHPEGLAHAPAHQRRHHQQLDSPWCTSRQASSSSPSHLLPTSSPEPSITSTTSSIGNSSPASGRSGPKLSLLHKTTPSGQSTPGQAIRSMPHIAASGAPATTGVSGRSCAAAASAGSPSGSAMHHSPLTMTPPLAPWVVRPSAALAKLRAWSTAAQAAHNEQVRAMARAGDGADGSSNSGSRITGGRGDGAHDQGCRAKHQDASLVQDSSSAISRGTPASKSSANRGWGDASRTPPTTHAAYSYQTTPQTPAPRSSATQYTLHMQSCVHSTLLHSGSHFQSAAEGHQNGGSSGLFKVDAATVTPTVSPGSGGGTEGALPPGEERGQRGEAGSSRRSLLHVLEGVGDLGEGVTHAHSSMMLAGHGDGGSPAVPGFGGVGEGEGGMSHAGGCAGSPTLASRHKHTHWAPPARLASCDEPTPEGAHLYTPAARVTHPSPGALSLQPPPPQPQPAAHPPYHPPAPRTYQKPTLHTTAHMPTPPRPTPTTPSSTPRAVAPTQGGGIPCGDVPACPLSEPRPPDRSNIRGSGREGSGHGWASPGFYSTGTPATSMPLSDHHEGGGGAMAGGDRVWRAGGGRSRSSAEVVREADDVLAAARQQTSDLLQVADRTVTMWKAKWAAASNALLDLQAQLEEARQHAEAVAQEAAQAAASKVAAEEAAAAAKAALDGSSKAVEAERGKAAAAEVQVRDLQQKVEELVAKVAQIEEEGAAEKARLEGELAAAKDEAERAGAEASTSQAEVGTLNRQLEEAQTEAGSSMQQLREAQAAAEAGEARAAQAEAEAEEARRGREGAKARATAAEAEAARLRACVERLGREGEGLRAQLTLAQRAQAAAEAAAQTARSDASRLTAALDEASQDLDARRAQAEEAGRDAGRAALLASALRGQMGELQAALSAAHTAQTASEDVAARTHALLQETRDALEATQAQHAVCLSELGEAQGAAAEAEARAERAGAQAQAAQAGLQAAAREVSQLRGRLQCMSGQDDALSSQPLAALEALEALLEASLPRVRAAFTRLRLEAARNEATSSAAAAAAAVAASAAASATPSTVATPERSDGGGGRSLTSSVREGGGDAAGAGRGGVRPPQRTPTRSRTTMQQLGQRSSMPLGAGGAQHSVDAHANTRRRALHSSMSSDGAGDGGEAAEGGAASAAPPPTSLSEDGAEVLSQCAVCFAAPRNTVLNCGHLFCSSCASRIDRCPMCRARIVTRGPAFV